MSVEKISLTSLRYLLFFFFGGVGCLLPYLSLHINRTGLTTYEARLISIISPLIASLGPLIGGPLADYLCGKRRSTKFETRGDSSPCVRTILSAAILLAASSYSLLLAVPTLDRVQPREPRVSFVCNEYGASLVQEKCNDVGCYQFPPENRGLIQLKDCKFNCSYPSHYGNIENPPEPLEDDVKTTATTTTSTAATTSMETATRKFIQQETDITNLDNFFRGDEKDDEDLEFGSGEEPFFDWNKRNTKREAKEDSELSLEDSEPPHICYDHYSKKSNKVKNTVCTVYTPYSAVFDVNVSLRPVYADDHFCNYNLGGNFFCRIPGYMEKPNESCKVICDLQDAYATGNVLANSQCQDVRNPGYTFWLYLVFRSSGDLFTALSISLLIGATLVAARNDIGREFILPSISYGLFAVLIGYLHSKSLSPLSLDNIPNFFLGIAGFGFLSLLALFVVIFSTNLPIGPPDWWWTNRNVPVRQKGELCGVLLVLVLIGALWGPIYFHVPWHIAEKTNLEWYIGCSIAMGALLSVPVVWKADTIIDYCGYSNVLICAFTFYILRYTGLLFVGNPWVLLITGGMEVFTLCFMIFSAIFYIRHLVPRHITFTSQSLGVAANFCIGNGLGCLVSTLLSRPASEIEALRSNSTHGATTEKSPTEEEESLAESLYYEVYSIGAISSAVIAIIYFLAYHCCLKKRCLAPPYRKEPSSLVQGPTGNGTYTPLRVYHNGRQQRPETS